MKRTRDPRAEKPDEYASYLQMKRPKANQACSSCRKHKTRCELLDAAESTSNSGRCHRCKVLNIACSFDNPDSLPVASGSTPRPAVLLSRGLPTDACPDTPPRGTTPIVPKAEMTDGALSRKTIRPQDLVPAPLTPWGFLKAPGGFDWTANPMLALQELSRRPQTPHSDPSVPLSGIITHDQKQYLLEMFALPSFIHKLSTLTGAHLDSS